MPNRGESSVDRDQDVFRHRTFGRGKASLAFGEGARYDPFCAKALVEGGQFGCTDGGFVSIVTVKVNKCRRDGSPGLCEYPTTRTRTRAIMFHGNSASIQPCPRTTNDEGWHSIQTCIASTDSGMACHLLAPIHQLLKVSLLIFPEPLGSSLRHT
jgi:hypothetical protein